MSAGCRKHAPTLGDAEVRKALADPKVKKALARPVRIDRTFDIPYLAGYAQDGRVIYIDRHLPQSLQIGRKRVAPIPMLLVHERTEKAIIDGLGWGYAASHEVATHQEHEKVRAAGLDPKAYERALRPYIKADEGERLKRCPPDLDLTPYKGESALLERIKAAQS